MNEFVSLRKEGHGGKREELISKVVDHYPHHTCVKALITSFWIHLSHPSPTNNKLSAQWQTEDIRVIVPKHAALQNDPAPPQIVNLLPVLCLPPLSLQASAWGCWILHTSPSSSIPTWLLRINPLPSFFRLTQSVRCCAVLLSDTSVGCTVASTPTKLDIPTRLQKWPVLPQHQQIMYLLFFL